MSDFDSHPPDDLRDAERRLRENRHGASEIELDQIKTRPMARSRSSRPQGTAVRSRLLVAVCTVGLMAGGTGGVSAGGGIGNSDTKSASKS